MAEIRVEPKKRSMLWLWMILLLVIIAAAVWYFTMNGRTDVNTGVAFASPAPIGVVTS